MSTMTTYRRSIWPHQSSFRLVALVGAAVLASAGVTLHYLPHDTIGAYAGLALYAALVYAVVVLLVPRVRPKVAATVTAALCCAVELARLSPQTAELSARSAPARIVLGGTFNPANLAWYAVGVAAVLAAHSLAYRKARRSVSVDARAAH
jgi:hypothetical protein